MADPDPEKSATPCGCAFTAGDRNANVRSAEFVPHSPVDVSLLKTDEPLRFRCRYGVLDVLPELLGVGFFNDVRRDSRRYSFSGIELSVASIESIIKSKESADQVKDMHAMDALYEAQARLREESDPCELPAERLEVPDGDGK